MNVKALRTAKNIDVAIRFLGEAVKILGKKVDLLEEILSEVEKNCNGEVVVKLDEVTYDLHELYELINNLSEELNENLKEGGKNEIRTL